MTTTDASVTDAQTDESLVTACPACDSTKLYRRSRSIQRKQGEYDYTWRCEACGERFDDPTVREKHHNAINFEHDSLPDKLLRADPDEVSR